MAIIATAATLPPTIVAVCELLLENDAAGEDGDEERAGFADPGTVGLVVVGRPVGCGVVDVGLGVVAPINEPGPTSGLSEKRRCEESGNQKTERRFPTTNAHRCDHIPTILQLASDVGSCQRK